MTTNIDPFDTLSAVQFLNYYVDPATLLRSASSPFAALNVLDGIPDLTDDVPYIVILDVGDTIEQISK